MLEAHPHNRSMATAATRCINPPNQRAQLYTFLRKYDKSFEFGRTYPRKHRKGVPCMFYWRAMRSRADVLRFAIASALMKALKIAWGLRQGLTERERYAVADDVVRRLQERGDFWKRSFS